MDTTQLVLSAQEKDEQAVKELYYDSYRQAYTVALLMAGNGDDAYDIMQESYYKAFTNLDLLANKAGFGSWFNKIVILKIKDFLKKKRGIELFFNAANLPKEVYEGRKFCPQPDVDYSENAKLAAQMLGTLTAEQRLTFAATVLQELSVNELAETLDVTEGAVGNALNDGKFALQVQSELLDQGNNSLPVPPEETVSFISFLLCRDAGKADVHEMAPKVRAAALGEDAAAEDSELKEKASGKVFKSKGQLIAVSAAGAVALLALVFCFIVFALPKITGRQNVLSSVFFQDKSNGASNGEITPETLIQDFEVAFKNGDENAMAELYAPEERTKQKAKGFGLSMIMDFVNTISKGTVDYEFTMEEVTYDGDSASAPLTITAKLGEIKLKDFDYNVSFVKVDGVWYIKEFEKT